MHCLSNRPILCWRSSDARGVPGCGPWQWWCLGFLHSGGECGVGVGVGVGVVWVWCGCGCGVGVV